MKSLLTLPVGFVLGAFVGVFWFSGDITKADAPRICSMSPMGPSGDGEPITITAVDDTGWHMKSSGSITVMANSDTALIKTLCAWFDVGVHE